MRLAGAAVVDRNDHPRLEGVLGEAGVVAGVFEGLIADLGGRHVAAGGEVHEAVVAARVSASADVAADAGVTTCIVFN